MYRALADDLNPWWRDPAARRARAYPVRRHLQPKLLRQILNLGDRRAQVVEGPRQVGKTVMLRQLADDLLDSGWPPGNLAYFDFSDERLTESVPPREVAAIRPPGSSSNHPRVLLLDEITSAPAWDRWLKRAIDESDGAELQDKLRIVATDSSSTLLRAKFGESGLGRWDEHIVETLSLAELVDLYTAPSSSELAVSDRKQALSAAPRIFELYLSAGGFPSVIGAPDLVTARERLRADVLEKALLKDLVPFGLDFDRTRQLFAYLVETSGSELNVSERAGSLGADTRSVKAWLEALLGTRLLWPLAPWASQPAKKLGRLAKYFVADPGIVTAFAINPGEPGVRSRQFEAAVYRHLREALRGRRGESSFFREKSGQVEVDFVVDLGTHRVAVEVTSSRRVKNEKVEALRVAGSRVAADRYLIVHDGIEASRTEAGIELIPLPLFLLDTAGYLETPNE